MGNTQPKKIIPLIEADPNFQRNIQQSVINTIQPLTNDYATTLGKTYGTELGSEYSKQILSQLQNQNEHFQRQFAQEFTANFAKSFADQARVPQTQVATPNFQQTTTRPSSGIPQGGLGLRQSNSNYQILPYGNIRTHWTESLQ